jgi:hypothetical protein
MSELQTGDAFIVVQYRRGESDRSYQGEIYQVKAVQGDWIAAKRISDKYGLRPRTQMFNLRETVVEKASPELAAAMTSQEVAPEDRDTVIAALNRVAEKWSTYDAMVSGQYSRLAGEVLARCDAAIAAMQPKPSTFRRVLAWVAFWH